VLSNRPIEIEVLIFELGEHSVGIALADVIEVLRAVAIQPLPGAPAIVEGVINVRGAVVPVLDVRARFGEPACPLDASHHFMLVSAGRRVAVRVDRCIGIARLHVVRSQDAALPAGVSHVAGFALVPSGVLVIHDLHAFLSETETQSLEQALRAQSARTAGVPA
jgi:purine-binding chemotaxis protein CheW